MKCGKVIPKLERDHVWEQAAIRELVGGLSADPVPLIKYAASRALVGEIKYGFAFPEPSRDLVVDAIEEFGDAVNYPLWKLDQIRRGLCEQDTWMVEHLQRALRFAALGFEEMLKCYHGTDA